MGTAASKHHRHRTPERPSPPGKPILIPSLPDAEPDVISIRWEPPIHNGGVKLLGYLVEHRRTGSPHWVRATPVLVRGTTLTLSGLEPGMRYQFRVTAENEVGRSDPGQLSEAFAVSYQRYVSLAPSFVKPLGDITGIENEKVEFSVVVEGTPTPKISWFKDGFELFSNRRQRIIVEGEKSSLIIHQAALNDEGEIKCTATNKAGHVVTKAKLTLEAGAGVRLPRQYEDGLLFELGEAIKLRVGVTGRPEPTVSWYHDGAEITKGGRVELTRTDRYACLRVAEAARSDRGDYRITASNKLGTDSASILITITDRPLAPGKALVVMTMGRCVTLSWSAPDDDGGCKIGNYIVEYYRIGWNMWLKAATCRQLSTTLGDLIEGSEYKFRVKAENPYGVSDPSEETDVVFIPDPKRGLLEPPVKGESGESFDAGEEWIEAKRKHKELEQREIWEDTPSPITLANQVLRKVKMAPKRGWSEDSQQSPSVTPERQLFPIAPTRKKRDKKKAQAIVEECFAHSEEEMSYIRRKSPELQSSPKPKKSFKSENQEVDLRRYSNAEDNVHSSSEMMIVLLPNAKDSIIEKTEKRKTESFEENMDYSTNIVPPMSLSSPELSSCEPIELGSLRCSVSSSELLHERTLARMNKDIADEEAEHALKIRYGVERKRSFERKSNKERNYEITPKEIEQKSNPEKDKNNSDISTDYPILRKSSKEKFLQSDSSFEEFSTRIDKDDDDNDEEEDDADDDSDYEEDSDYDDEDDEYDESSDIEMKYDFESSRISRKRKESIEKETYHPRNMDLALPHPPKLNDTVPVNVSPKILRKIPVITVNEELLDLSPPMFRKENSNFHNPALIPDIEIRRSRSPDIELVRFTPLETKKSKSPEKDLRIGIIQNIDNTSPPSPTSMVPKPILKVRDQVVQYKPTERKFAANLMSKMSLRKSPLQEPPKTPSPKLENKKSKKKVRIEEPLENEEEYILEGEDLVMTGEVAKNRRKGANRQKREQHDPSNVIVSHYSDIVKEFGSTQKKQRPTMYLNYEDLKAAAERSERTSGELNLNQTSKEVELTMTKNVQDSNITQETSNNQNNSVIITNFNERTKVQIYSEFLLDLFLFFIASYIYMVKDPWLAVPVIILMVYRQLHEIVGSKLRHWKIFSKKSPLSEQR